MTRRTRILLVTGGALTAATLAGGGLALAADSDEPTRDQVRFVVEEGNSNTNSDDCPEKDSATNGGAAL